MNLRRDIVTMVREIIVTLFRPTPFKVGIVCILSSCLLWYSFGYEKPALFTAIDSRMVDAMFRFRGPQETTDKVVVIDIDEKSLKQFGQWPWSRDLVAVLTRKIFAAGALVIGFDILFAENDRSSPSELFHRHEYLLQDYPGLDSLLARIDNSRELNYDLLLGDAISQGNSVLGYSFLLREDNLKDNQATPFPSLNISLNTPQADFQEVTLISAYRAVLNIPEVSSGSSEGFFNVFPDPNGTIRKVPLFMKMDHIPYPSLAFEMVRIGLGENGAVLHLSTIGQKELKPMVGVSLGSTFFRTDDYGQLTVNFRGPFNTFPYLSAADVLAGEGLEILDGKYVIIGSSASGIMDLVATPFSARMPGVEVHANVIDNLLQNDPLVWENYTEIGLTYFLIIAAGLLILFSLVFLGPFLGFSVGIASILVIVCGNYYLLFLNQQLLGLSFILTALLTLFILVTFSNYLFEGRKRTFIRRAFSQYVAPSVVSQLLRNPQSLNISAETREVTILFCDIRNFTTFSENTPATELSHFLNEYFSRMTEIIIKNNGMVDKYIGDAIMAVWGTPLDDRNHAANAVRSALEMVETVGRNETGLKMLDRNIEIGVGLNSGLVSAGNFGSSDRFDYTVLGDNVNLASRIEGLTKYYQVPILVSKSTREAATAFDYTFVDTVLVKGRNKPVDIFLPNRSKPIDNSSRQLYHQGIRLYKQGDFSAALALFEQLAAIDNNSLVRLYLTRCQELVRNPPLPPWQGVYHHH